MVCCLLLGRRSPGTEGGGHGLLLRMFSEEELEGKTLGFDRGVTIPVMASSGRRIDFSSVQRIRMEKKERARKRWQRKLARQQNGLQNRKKTKQRLARSFEYAKNVKKDLIHKATQDLASDPRPEPLRRRGSQAESPHG